MSEFIGVEVTTQITYRLIEHVINASTSRYQGDKE
jgi:hypothetical protein